MSDTVGELLGWVLSEDAFKKRLVELVETTGQAHAAQETLRIQTEAHNQALAEIQHRRRALEAEKAALDEQQKKLQANTDALTKLINNHNAERMRWEAVREQVDDAHAKRELEHAKVDDVQEEVVKQQRAMHDALEQREAAIADREKAHAQAAAHAKAFMEAVTP